jgi:hypothetical protein
MRDALFRFVYHPKIGCVSDCRSMLCPAGTALEFIYKLLTSNQVSSLRDFGKGRISVVRKLKHTVNKVPSLRDLSFAAI